jgi:hypothetical protein
MNLIKQYNIGGYSIAFTDETGLLGTSLRCLRMAPSFMKIGLGI